ncbi:MAG: hypothetical protein HQ513_18605 [Rhodospirillales bacterium]|nr:hypothetical protein [Rhodospirillales bacterium]
MDKELEKAIDDAGKEAVCNVIRSAGFSANESTPEWMWITAIKKVKAGVKPLAA